MKVANEITGCGGVSQSVSRTLLKLRRTNPVCPLLHLSNFPTPDGAHLGRLLRCSYHVK